MNQFKFVIKSLNSEESMIITIYSQTEKESKEILKREILAFDDSPKRAFRKSSILEKYIKMYGKENLVKVVDSSNPQKIVNEIIKIKSSL